MTDGLEDLIADIKGDYKKTNIREINLEEDTQLKINSRIGYFLKHADNISEREYTINFDPLQNIFLQKLVSEQVLKKRVILTKDEYFKGIVFVEHLTSIILNSHEVLDDFYEIAQHLEEIDKTLDPDLKLFSLYAAVYNKGNSKNMTKAKKSAIKRKYNSNNKTVSGRYLDYRKIDAFYESLGNQVSDLVSNETVKSELQNIQGVSDLKAMIFTDILLPMIDETDQKKTLDMVSKGNYFDASFYAMNKLSEDTKDEDVSNYVRAMVK